MRNQIPWLAWRAVDPYERGAVVAFARSQRLVEATVSEAAGKAASRKAAAKREARRG